MRFLVDENLSPRVAELLSEDGHDAVHVREVQAAGAPDSEVMSIAQAQGRVVISADTDFGVLIAQARALKPSVVLVREFAALRPTELAASAQPPRACAGGSASAAIMAVSWHIGPSRNG